MMSTNVNYQAHETAVIDEGAGDPRRGQGVALLPRDAGMPHWANALWAKTRCVAPGVVLGANVKVQNNVSIYKGVHVRRRRLPRAPACSPT